jgi:NAD(P)-dependent dehydrogenase (short-subunit alcohol dehydrogenase family)
MMGLKGTMDPHIQGKCALVTGGARNIGLAIARELGAHGASVAIVDICHDLETIPYALSTPEDLVRGVKELTDGGIPAMGLECDVRVESQVQNAVMQVIEKLGGVDVLVNNAGVSSLYPIQQISQTCWDEVVDVSLKGTYLCCKHVVPHMIKQQGGTIVNIASVAGIRGLGYSAHYCAAKHGVVGLTRALAMELADHRIHVHAVCPGTVESPILPGLAAQAGADGDAYAHFSKGHLFQDQRIAPEDIARAVRWLVSGESRCLTGTILPVDGGWSVRG